MKDSDCCGDAGSCSMGGFKVEAIVNVDERGQMELPKDFLARAKIEAGEKMALVSFENNGEFCCMCMIKTDALVGMVREHLGPLVGELNLKS